MQEPKSLSPRRRRNAHGPSSTLAYRPRPPASGECSQHHLITVTKGTRLMGCASIISGLRQPLPRQSSSSEWTSGTRKPPVRCRTLSAAHSSRQTSSSRRVADGRIRHPAPDRVGEGRVGARVAKASRSALPLRAKSSSECPRYRIPCNGGAVAALRRLPLSAPAPARASCASGRGSPSPALPLSRDLQHSSGTPVGHDPPGPHVLPPRADPAGRVNEHDRQRESHPERMDAATAGDQEPGSRPAARQ